MKISLYKQGVWQDITQYVTMLTISGEYRTCCRTADFDIIQSITDKNIKQLGINIGDIISASENEKNMLYGKVWTKSKGTDGNTITLSIRDYGIYLLKNKASYSFQGITPEAITAKIAADYNIKINKIMPTGVPITRKFLNTSLYQIIMTAYTLANDKKYICVFDGEFLNVIEKGQFVSMPINSGFNLLTSNVSQSLESMLNKVNVYNSKGVLLNTYKSDNDIKLYGVMSENIKLVDDKENYALKAQRMIKGVESKIKVTNFGDANYITGKSVVVTEPYTGIKGKFFIDEDKHIWKNGIYTNALTLNYQNIMDEKQSGSEINKTSSTSKSKKGYKDWRDDSPKKPKQGGSNGQPIYNSGFNDKLPGEQK
ncbi:MAG: hypothetical protein RSD67_05980 [Oscillospiraceae bacterium]